MYANGASARRRRILIASGAEPTYSADQPDDAQAEPAEPAVEVARLRATDTRGTVSDIDSPRIPHPLRIQPHGPSDALPSPVNPPARHIATAHARLQPSLPDSSRWRPVELCVTSRLTGEAEVLRIDSSIASIGRGSQCDIRLMHADVSRRHACIQVLEAGVICFDLGGRTGVLWAGQRRPVGWITSQHPVEIGPFEVRLATPDDAIAGSDDHPPESAIPPNGAADDEDGIDAGSLIAMDSTFESMGFEIEQTSPDKHRREESDCDVKRFLPLQSPVARLGRGPDCELRLNDDKISRVHSSVMSSSDSVWLVDLAGRGGVSVNGIRISHARLQPGDSVALGQHRLRFVSDRPLSPPSREDGSATRGWKTSEPITDADDLQSPAIVSAPMDQSSIPGARVAPTSAALADMRRRMQNQQALQITVIEEMAESLATDIRNDVRAELKRLKSLGEEIWNAQSEWIASTIGPAEAIGQNGGVAPQAPAPRADRPNEASDHLIDHVAISRLRTLDEEYKSRWHTIQRLLNAESVTVTARS